MERATVDFEEYNENWVRMFQDEKRLLSSVFGEIAIRIEHFGSTSVPGLAGKPIIDIFVFVRDMSHIEQYNAAMECHGYSARGEQALTGCKVFVKHKTNSVKRSHKVNICTESNTFSINALLFRDYLRINKEACETYENKKKELARKYFDNPVACGKGKQDCVTAIIEEAKRYFTK